MSRPFSYNDENFTVIGNLLFVHIRYLEAIDANKPLLEIPPAIYSRMITYSNVAIESSESFFSGGTVGVKIIVADNKPYFALAAKKSETDIDRYYFCFYLLKDI